MSEYDHLADAAYLRAKEDYLMGINFSRLLTLKYGQSMSNYLGYEVYRYFCGARNDMCAWHGGAART